MNRSKKEKKKEEEEEERHLKSKTVIETDLRRENQRATTIQFY